MSQKTNPNKPQHKNPTRSQDLEETVVTLLAADSLFEGDLTVSSTARIHGKFKGTLKGTSGSLIIIGESALLEGTVSGDAIVIDGCIQGDVTATGKVSITATGRVLGNIRSPALEIDFGALFEGACTNPAAPGSLAGAPA